MSAPACSAAPWSRSSSGLEPMPHQGCGHAGECALQAIQDGGWHMLEMGLGELPKHVLDNNPLR
eukprot:8781557-Lingulodinium_polyedra.AAC.1